MSTGIEGSGEGVSRPALRFGIDACEEYETAIGKEWLETNGIGGYAASTILGVNVRRYHGLLMAATGPPLVRYLLLSRLEETAILGGHRVELSTNQYGGAVHPKGYIYQEWFELNPFPAFRFRVGDTVIEKRVFMVHGQNTTVVTYSMPMGGEEVLLEVRPLIAFRDDHFTTHENPSIRGGFRPAGEGILSIEPYPGVSPLYLSYDAEDLDDRSWWYRDFWYPVETERGLDDREDLFSPLGLTYRFRPGETHVLLASTEPADPEDWRSLEGGEIQRRSALVLRSGVRRDLFLEALTEAADRFLIRRPDGLTSVIAGYPWFGEWGRDAMIALPGLTLVTGRFDEARAILSVFARHCDRGMIPNRFPDRGAQPDYNTVDATLWMLHASERYLDYTGDESFLREVLWETMVQVVEHHVRGTRYGIGVAEDGLLKAGEPGVQLTWMDAKVGDWVVTPRYGKAVEVNALWHRGLSVMSRLALRFGEKDAADEYRLRADRVRECFTRTFWNDPTGCLCDVVDGSHRDETVRPNQIFAVSLPGALLDDRRARGVVDVVERDLLTPVGLRSLSPRDSRYRGRYAGDVWSRDGAYHQGTVWAWLMGPFLTAYVKVRGGSPEGRERAGGLLSGMRAHLTEAGLGSISEIFDGDPPHLPRGCFAQAWSVAEVLRAYVEDVLGRVPGAR